MFTFCLCIKRITKKKHKAEVPYMHSVIKQFLLNFKLLDKKLKIKQIHLGVGTPTFFFLQNL
jgi:oxygen-independent coproporphyrinogen-3 oxidase